MRPDTAPDRPIAVVLGTRPEIVKLGHLVALLGDAARVVHTGQHYDPGLSDSFLESFGLGAPDLVVGVGGETRGTQIGAVASALDAHLRRVGASAVVVQGDTNSTAGAAIAANACEVPLVHVEAGLRSFDRRMPEEHNRVIADHLADLCLAPTEVNRANLRAEGIPDERIVVTGNTVVGAVTALLPPPEERATVLTRHGVERNRYVLSTFHRPENVDDPSTLTTVLTALAGIELPVVLPLHPRTESRLDPSQREIAAALDVVEPLGYRDFLSLAAEAAFMVSDSGGVQEEASVVKRPVIVVRRSTERPEVLGTFAELVEPGPEIGAVAGRWLADLDGLHAGLADVPSPYGDEHAAERSKTAIEALLR